MDIFDDTISVVVGIYIANTAALDFRSVTAVRCYIVANGIVGIDRNRN